MRAFLFCAIAYLSCATAGLTQDRSFILAVDPQLKSTGLIEFVVPRFALKYGIRPTVSYGDGAADAVISVGDPENPVAGERPVFFTATDPEVRYVISTSVEGERSEEVSRFLDWILGEIGQRTVTSFQPDGYALFTPGTRAAPPPPPPAPTGNASVGERLSLLHCGRCHVVGDKNRMGGIGSAPSFGALRSIPGWQDKFLAFWSENPHPSFTQVEGLTTPFDPNHPPHIAPIELTEEDVEAIFAFAATIPPKDLGAPISER